MVSDQITNYTSSAVAPGELFGLSFFLSLPTYTNYISGCLKKGSKIIRAQEAAMISLLWLLFYPRAFNIKCLDTEGKWKKRKVVTKTNKNNLCGDGSIFSIRDKGKVWKTHSYKLLLDLCMYGMQLDKYEKKKLSELKIELDNKDNMNSHPK